MVPSLLSTNRSVGLQGRPEPRSGTFPNAWYTSQRFAEAPCGPLGPAGPGAPCGPVGPVGPATPCGPVAPAAPWGPVVPIVVSIVAILEPVVTDTGYVPAASPSGRVATIKVGDDETII